MTLLPVQFEIALNPVATLAFSQWTSLDLELETMFLDHQSRFPLPIGTLAHDSTSVWTKQDEAGRWSVTIQYFARGLVPPVWIFKDGIKASGLAPVTTNGSCERKVREKQKKRGWGYRGRASGTERVDVMRDCEGGEGRKYHPRGRRQPSDSHHRP